MNKFEQDIAVAAQHAYEQIGAGYNIDPTDMPRTRTCRMTSLAMKWALEKMSYEVVTEERSLVPESNHYYLNVFSERKMYIVDPTWQQFVYDSYLQELPDVLLGSREQVVHFARKAGMGREFIGLWLPVHVPQEAIMRHPAVPATILQK